jgi:hypothetical protein
MPTALALKTWLHDACRSAAFALRALLIVSIILFAAQPAGALAAHHAMNSPGAAAVLSDIHGTPAAQLRDTECCQPAEQQPACPDCVAVSCAAAPATLAAAATIRIFRRPLRHVFFEPAFDLSPHSLPPELGPPRA